MACLQARRLLRTVRRFSICSQDGRAAVACLRELDEDTARRDNGFYRRLLQWCGRMQDATSGRKVHDHIVSAAAARGSIPACLGNSLISMYGKCGDLEAAGRVFEQLGDSRRSTLSWNCFISASIDHGRKAEALQLFRRMLLLNDGRQAPDRVTCITALSACDSPAFLPEGKLVHSHVATIGAESDVVVATAVLNMYSRCGSLDDVQLVFDRMEFPNSVSWTSLVAAYAQRGHFGTAFRLFYRMLQQGVRPERATILTISAACTGPSDIGRGRAIHSLVLESDDQQQLWSDDAVATVLITMYGKCGSLEDAGRVFESWPRTLQSWNSIMAVLMLQDEQDAVAGYYRLMQLEGVRPARVTFNIMLKTCANGELLDMGRMVHEHIVECGCQAGESVENALVNMYGKCSSLEDARFVFEGMAYRDVVSWTAMVTAYAQSGEVHTCREAMVVFRQMQLQGVRPNGYTLVSALGACVVLEDLHEGRQLHSQVRESGLGSNSLVNNALVRMYCKCGGTEEAAGLFLEQTKQQQTLVSWTTIIAALAQQEQHHRSLFMFRRMLLEGLDPDAFTLVTALNSCASLATAAAVAEGKLIHARMSDKFQMNDFLGNALVGFYTKCGDINEAEGIFQSSGSLADVGVWNEMIAAYAHDNRKTPAEVVNFFRGMQLQGVRPNANTIAGVLSACAAPSSFKLGASVHAQALNWGIDDRVMRNAMVSFYGKCGRLTDAEAEFERQDSVDPATWNAVLSAYAGQGQGAMVLKVFRRMQQGGIRGNRISFVTVLSACSHAGYLEEGYHIFVAMEREHGVKPVVDHYACVVDMLGRAGWLETAQGIVQKMPVPADDVLWMTLLAACCNHGEVDRGKLAATKAIQCQPDHAAPYVVLSRSCASSS